MGSATAATVRRMGITDGVSQHVHGDGSGRQGGGGGQGQEGHGGVQHQAGNGGGGEEGCRREERPADRFGGEEASHRGRKGCQTSVQGGSRKAGEGGSRILQTAGRERERER